MRLVYILLVLLYSSNTIAENNWNISLGGDIGNCSAVQNEKMISDCFGKDSYTSEIKHYYDGGDYLATVLYPESKDKRLVLFWINREKRENLGFVRVEGSKWVITNTFFLGQSIKDVQIINENPFRLITFDTDQAGLIVDWQGGKIKKLYPNYSFEFFFDWDFETHSEEESKLVYENETVSSDIMIELGFNVVLDLVYVHFQ